MPSQEELCRVVHPILRWGMLISLVLMLIGLALGMMTGDQETGMVALESLPSSLMDLRPTAILTTGVLLLILTPLARVLGALLVFVREGDRRFVLVSLTVLSAIIAAVLLGAA